MLKIRLTKNKSEFLKVLKIRKEVFVKEQNVALDIEVDGLDSSSKHVMATYNDKVIGCARLRFYKNKLKAQRIAVLRKYRGKGFGKDLMLYIVKYAKRKKLKEVYFEAQYYIKGFYEKLGFKVRGKSFIEELFITNIFHG